MRPTGIWVSTIALSLAVSPALATDGGYDPLALDHFVEANLAIEALEGGETPANSEDLVLAQEKLHFDSEGYLVGPDGERIYPLVRIRWQIGVYR